MWCLHLSLIWSDCIIPDCALTMFFHEQQHHMCLTSLISCCYWFPTHWHHLAWPAAPPGLGCHLPCLAKRACFSVQAEKGKTVLCRSADKNLPLVTHCPTNALTPTSWNRDQPPSWLVSKPKSVDSKDCKDLVIHPFWDYQVLFACLQLHEL